MTYSVGWDVKLYSLTHANPNNPVKHGQIARCIRTVMVMSDSKCFEFPKRYEKSNRFIR